MSRQVILYRVSRLYVKQYRFYDTFSRQVVVSVYGTIKYYTTVTTDNATGIRNTFRWKTHAMHEIIFLHDNMY